ncbi:MAG: hypothetical protein WC725_05105 [Patescibacteria group bacterium]|jgi:hypothetical protein
MKTELTITGNPDEVLETIANICNTEIQPYINVKNNYGTKAIIITTTTKGIYNIVAKASSLNTNVNIKYKFTYKNWEETYIFSAGKTILN